MRKKHKQAREHGKHASIQGGKRNEQKRGGKAVISKPQTKPFFDPLAGP